MAVICCRVLVMMVVAVTGPVALPPLVRRCSAGGAAATQTRSHSRAALTRYAAGSTCGLSETAFPPPCTRCSTGVHCSSGSTLLLAAPQPGPHVPACCNVRTARRTAVQGRHVGRLERAATAGRGGHLLDWAQPAPYGVDLGPNCLPTTPAAAATRGAGSYYDFACVHYKMSEG